MGGPRRKKSEEKISALHEPPTKSLSVKVGETLYDWLKEESKERFGLANQAGLLRLILYEKYLAETQAEAAPAEGNGQ